MTDQHHIPDEPQAIIKETTPSTKPKRVGWLLYFGVAFLIAIWTALGGLFFLAVAGVLRMNPKADISYAITKNNKKVAQRVYTWLFFSPIITVPIFIGMAINIHSRSTINERVLAALVPLLPHLFLLLGLTSSSAFVYRHTQQGILFIALRAGLASLAAINVDSHIDYALLLFFFGNGSLWLAESIIGWSQSSNGTCWFMERKGEQLLLPAANKPVKTVTPVNEQELDELLKSLDAPGTTTARQKAMHAFRTGTPEIKKRAIRVLFQLGEVEKF